MKQLVAVLAVAGLIACSGEQATTETGGFELSISGPQSQIGELLRNAAYTPDPSAASKVRRVSVYVAAVDEPGNFERCGNAYVGGLAGGWISGAGGVPDPITFPLPMSFEGIPAGCKVRIDVGATDNGLPSPTQLYEGFATFTVVARQVSTVNVLMQQVVAPESVHFVAPKITALTISDTTPEISIPVELGATVAFDEPGATVAYHWSAQCAGETAPAFSNANGLTTTLTMTTCQSDATVTFRVTASNIPGVVGEVKSTVSFALDYNPQGVAPSIDINSWPNISSISILNGANAQPLPGTMFVFGVEASDPDNDPLTYTWSSSCAAAPVVQLVAGSANWTAPAIAGPCTITVVVTDGRGGTNDATFAVNVANEILTVAPHIAVCIPGVWTCESVTSYEDAASYVDATGLHLVKSAADTSAVAFGPNARILGVVGMALTSASFDAVGSIGGGSPRFIVRTATGACPLELVNATVSGSTYTFAPTATCGGVLTGLDIVADMGGQAGSVTLTNIKVNGIPVVM
jgi:hypothetical protein